ncbi:MAG TPA: hypothetical protein VJJ76_02175 [archaeon]|nr:hypothetical protein [archaeon]
MTNVMNKKIFAAVLCLVIALPAVVFASNFAYVKSIRFTPIADIDLLETFPGNGIPQNDPTWFDLSSFTQSKSISRIILRNDTDHQEIYLSIKNSGKLTVNSRNITATIEIENDNQNIECSEWSDEGIFCSGENLVVKIKGIGYRWTGTIDNFDFEMDGGLLGFDNAELVGYENSVEVLRVNLPASSFSFSYFKHDGTNRTRFTFAGGDAEWINTPTTGLGSSGIVFDFNNFTQTSLGGHGYIRRSFGYGGSVTLNLQGTLDVNGTTRPIRNEIYVNLNKLQYSDCPIFNSTNILCYVRSGYIHSYIPQSRDITLWKTFPEVFVLEIADNQMSLTAGENSADDLLSISGIDVADFTFV